MPDTSKAKQSNVNWTAVTVTAGLVGLGVIAWKIIDTVQNGSPADQEAARLVMEHWQQEFDVLQPYVESIYANGRTPTDEEIATLSTMVNEMSLKEITINNYSRNVFDEFTDLAKELAADWWLVPISVAGLVIVPIAGYVGYKLVRRWFNNRRPPPGGFACPTGDGFVGASEAELKNHVELAHPPKLTYATQAQAAFQQTSGWVQSAVAVETYFGNTYTSWSTWGPGQIGTLNWGLVNAIVYGIGSALESATLTTALLLLI